MILNDYEPHRPPKKQQATSGFDDKTIVVLDDLALTCHFLNSWCCPDVLFFKVIIVK